MMFVNFDYVRDASPNMMPFRARLFKSISNIYMLETLKNIQK